MQNCSNHSYTQVGPQQSSSTLTQIAIVGLGAQPFTTPHITQSQNHLSPPEFKSIYLFLVYFNLYDIKNAFMEDTI